MVNFQKETKETSFQTQGRLLQELGERLVAKTNVALLELIKNAYDADASTCEVKSITRNVQNNSNDHSVKDGTESNTKSIQIVDNGHGMTEKEFLDNWMQIATPDKQRQRQSRIYKRQITGSKGIGRFAVRFLGRYLMLETTAIDEKDKTKKLITAKFDWEQIDKVSQLNTYKIKYTIELAPINYEVGTILTIEKLRNPNEDQLDNEGRTELLSMIDPYAGLETGGFGVRKGLTQDPGFNVIIPNIIGKNKNGTDEKSETNVASFILKNAYAHLTIEHKNNEVKYLIKHKDGRVLFKRSVKYISGIEKGFFADIRYFVRRSGMFRNLGVDGRSVLKWLKNNGGIGIVDHGFRVRPYGFKDDDWLNLGLDTGHNRREWRSEFMNKFYPMPPEASSEAKLNPMLYLPNFHQLVGAVFLNSSHDKGIGLPTDITPSMDREGFVQNEGFKQLHELIRTGLEMLAYADHREQRRMEAENAQLSVEEMRNDFQIAIKYIEKIPTLSEGDKKQIVERFDVLTKELKNVQDYHKIATSKMETVALLGVLAGFLTHEMKRLIFDLDRILLEMKSNKSMSFFSNLINDIQKTRDEIVGQVQFASTYISNVQSTNLKNIPINVRSQIDRILDRFKFFINERNVLVEYEVDKKLLSPELPVTLYSGVLLNLITNALKAVFAGQGTSTFPKIRIKAWNVSKYHFLEVADSGIGIPEHLKDLIWDPFFSTTSGGSSNPLGSGMGLGLTLVKQLLAEVKGKIILVDPPSGYNTCFRVSYPR